MSAYGVSDEEASELRYFATEISARFEKSVFDVGRCLMRAKQLLKHGEYADWLTRELRISPRTAQLYVAATKRFGDDPAMQFMPPYVLKDLSGEAVSDEIVAEVVGKFRAGESLSKKQLQQLIRERSSRDGELTFEEETSFDGIACKIAKVSASTVFTIGQELWYVEQELGTAKFLTWVENHTFLTRQLARQYITATVMFRNWTQMHVYSHEVLLKLASVGADRQLVEQVIALGRRLGRHLSVEDIRPLLEQ